MPRLAPHVITALAVLSLLLCATLCALGMEVHHPIPIASLFVLPTAWPAACAAHYYRRRLVLHRRIAARQSLSCGYDLSRPPERCPDGRTSPENQGDAL